MTKRLGQVLALAGTISVLASCGGSSSGGGGSVNNGSPGFYITIRGMAFSPAQLAVPPGGTVTVVNQDAMPHSVTSEASPGSFTKAAVSGVEFDTGAFQGQTTFPIPANAPNGTMIPYFCTVHKGAMATPDAWIKVDNTAQPGPAPGGGGSGGGGY